MRAVTPRPSVWFASAVLGLGCAASVAAQPEPAKVLLQSADSLQIAAFWYANSGKGAPVAVLLHDPGQTHHAWRTLVTPLYRSGFQILALDLRGHGESKELTPEIYERMRQHETQPYYDMIRDIDAAVRWLGAEQKTPAARIALVGGGFSANLAIEAVARQQGLDFVALKWERFDLVVRRVEYFDPPLQRLFAFARTEPFAERAASLGGYNISNAGTVVFNGRR